MAASVTDLIDRVTDSTSGRPVIAALSATKSLGASSITIDDATNWTTTTGIHFSIYNTKVVGGETVKDPDTQTDWKGTLVGTTISGLSLTGGTDQEYSAGAIVELTPTARFGKDLYDLLIAFSNQDGTLKASAVQAALNLGSESLNGWNVLGSTPGTVTNNGNRSLDLVFSGVDITDTISPGMRLRTTRTVAAPDQCADLEASSSQYASVSSPSGITFTDDFTLEAWVKLESHTAGQIITRYDSGADDGFTLDVDSVGRPGIYGAGSGNRLARAHQALPIGVWLHLAGSLDMSGGTGTLRVNGVEITSTVTGSATSLTQAGNLQIGAAGGANFFDGKVADARIWSDIRTESEIRENMYNYPSDTTGLVAHFKLDGDFDDSSSNNNDLTASGGAAATNADSFMGVQGDNSVSTALDYAVVTATEFSTNTTVTVQVPEGCGIPTSGGITAVSYSAHSSPYNFVSDKNRWAVYGLIGSYNQTSGFSTTFAEISGGRLTIPVGPWRISALINFANIEHSSTSTRNLQVGISTATSSADDAYSLAVIYTRPGASVSDFRQGAPIYVERHAAITAGTPYYLIFAPTATTSVLEINVSGATFRADFNYV